MDASNADLPPADGPSADDGFAKLGLPTEVLRELALLGYEEPTPIQVAAIPPLIEGRDLLGQAATGTGKTAAFALPILSSMSDRDTRGPTPVALVLVPTRELAMQVSQAVHRYGRGVGVRVVPVYGGQPIGRQLESLRRGVDVVVATPGRALDHLERRTLVLDDVRTVVLDEADEMLDMGFTEDLESILAAAPEDRQTVLFSATMPGRIAGLARRHLTDPVRVEIERDAAEPGTAPQLRQRAFVVPRSHKAAALGRVLDVDGPAGTIVFCRTRVEVDQLTETLNGRGYRAEGLHGGMSQEQRDRVMGRLRAGTADLLVATDVAARGLDVSTLTHVVNYDVPSAPEAYVHRVGRVGRAGREGVAITLVEPREHRLLRNIERVTGQRIPIEKVPTVADLRSRRAELLEAAVRGAVESDDLDRFRAIVGTLAAEHDVATIAAAALKMAHDAVGGDEHDEEIPEAPTRSRGEGREARDAQGAGRDAGDRPRSGAPRGGHGGGPAAGTVRLFVGAGRQSGMRPQDLVGAITGETSLQGREIGAIRISERFSLVEVPERAVDEVLWSLRRTTIKGRKVKVRRDRDTGG